jgi:hypothetical protein
MTWVKLDDGFAEHPTITGLSHAAFRLYVAALGRSSRKLSDGHLTPVDVTVLRVENRVGPKAVTELEQAGKWVRNGDGGYVIRDYLDYNPPAEQVKDRRRKWAETKRVQRGVHT